MALIYGIHPVREALRAGSVERLLIRRDGENRRLGELVGMARSLGVDVRFEPGRNLDALSEGCLHQGVVAYVTPAPLLDAETLMDRGGDTPLHLLLDGIEDPHNLGAILRSADGAGVTGVFLPKRRSAPLSETVWKTSAGAVQNVPIARTANIVTVMEKLKDRGFWVTGTDGSATKLWHEVDYTGPTALVFGREGEGLHRLVKEHCDHLVKLPMLGSVSSLNVSASAAVLLYEVVRQRKLKGNSNLSIDYGESAR